MTGLDVLASLGVALAWLSVGGLWLQTARGGRALPRVDVSDATAEAGRRALRRGTWIALGLTADIALVRVLLPQVSDSLTEIVLRVLVFAACPMVIFWGRAPLGRRERLDVVAEAGRGDGRRTASLVVRDEDEILPRRWWIAPVALVALPLAVLAWTWAAYGPPTTPTLTTVAVSLAFAMSFLGAFGAWARLSASTSQDLSGAADAARLDEACRSFRRYVARGVFGLMTLVAVVAAAVAVAAIATDGRPSLQNAWCAYLGGVGGAVVGLGGGVLGAFADRHRRAIRDLGGVPPEPGVSCRG